MTATAAVLELLVTTLITRQYHHAEGLGINRIFHVEYPRMLGSDSF